LVTIHIYIIYKEQYYNDKRETRKQIIIITSLKDNLLFGFRISKETIKNKENIEENNIKYDEKEIVSYNGSDDNDVNIHTKKANILDKRKEDI